MNRFGLLFFFIISFMPGFGQIAVNMYPYAFQRKDIMINAGVGIWYQHPNHNFSNSSLSGVFLPASLTVEYGLTNWLSVGPCFSIFPQTYYLTEPNSRIRFHANDYLLGGRASFHFAPWLEKHLMQWFETEYLDLYFSLGAGYQSTLFYRREFSPETRLNLFSTLGIRYFFFEHFSLFTEVGYGPFEFMKVGVSGRF